MNGLKHFVITILTTFSLISCGGSNGELPAIPAPEPISPTIVSITPVNNTAVVSESSVFVNFDMVMDESTIDSSTFTVINKNTNEQVKGRFIFTDKNVQFDPFVNLNLLSKYEITLSGVKSKDGGKLKEFKSSFSIADGFWSEQAIPLIYATVKPNKKTFISTLNAAINPISGKITLAYSEIDDDGIDSGELYVKEYVNKVWNAPILVHETPNLLLFNYSLNMFADSAMLIYGTLGERVTNPNLKEYRTYVSRSDWVMPDTLDTNLFQLRNWNSSPNGKTILITLKNNQLGYRIYNAKWQGVKTLMNGAMPLNAATIYGILPFIFDDGSAIIFYTADKSLMVHEKPPNGDFKPTRTILSHEFRSPSLFSLSVTKTKITIITKYIDDRKHRMRSGILVNGIRQWSDLKEIPGMGLEADVQHVFQFSNDEIMVIYAEGGQTNSIVKSIYFDNTGWQTPVTLSTGNIDSSYFSTRVEATRLGNIITIVWKDKLGLKSNRYSNGWLGEQTIVPSRTVDDYKISSAKVPRVVSDNGGIAYVFWLESNLAGNDRYHTATFR